MLFKEILFLIRIITLDLLSSKNIAWSLRLRGDLTRPSAENSSHISGFDTHERDIILKSKMFDKQELGIWEFKRLEETRHKAHALIKRGWKKGQFIHSKNKTRAV